MPRPPIAPDQTPVTFLKGGAAEMFSAKCKEELLKANYRPEWFGSYSYVAKKVNGPARKKCDKYDEAVKKGRKKLPPKPTAEEEYLASCDSGHLVQNAAFQDPDGRDDPCANLDSAPGHSTSDYPCMPQAGEPSDPATEHGRATAHEKESARKQGKPGSKYPGKAIQDDADKRTALIVNDKQLADRSGRKLTKGRGGKEGGSAGASARSGGSAAAASGASGRKASKPNEPWNQEIKGKTAAECINNFRKAGEAAMRQKCVDEVEKNKKTAGTQAYRDKLEAQAAAAEKKAKANPRSKRAQRAATQAKARFTKAKNAACRAEQGVRLRKMGPKGILGPFDGAVPANATPDKNKTVSGGTTIS